MYQYFAQMLYVENKSSFAIISMDQRLIKGYKRKNKVVFLALA